MKNCSKLLQIYYNFAKMVETQFELSHFRSSMSTSSILELFLDKLHIPSIVTHDPPLDFTSHPLDIFYASPGSSSKVEDE